ncbi:MAG: winged helix-turn-helix transcriptional regulator [Lachnospiraceae bacterium]|nr:winged helix-turn-helix transcriptional regulator [Lachnospiraceae bacterium]
MISKELQGWEAPTVEEQYAPDRTILTLAFTEKQAEKTNHQTTKTIENKKLIMEFLEEKGSSKAREIAEHIGLSSARTRVILSELMESGEIQTEGNGRSRAYIRKRN